MADMGRLMAMTPEQLIYDLKKYTALLAAGQSPYSLQETVNYISQLGEELLRRLKEASK